MLIYLTATYFFMGTDAEFGTFLEKQNEIYGKFEAGREKVLSEGTKVHNLEGKGGYLVAFRHPPDVLLGIEKVSARVNEYVKSVLYGRQNIHSTIADADIRDNFQPDRSVLVDLARGVEGSNLMQALSGRNIRYSSFLVNQDSVIAKGIPNRELWALMAQINANIADGSVKPRAAWGAHVTVARFAQSVSGPKCRELVEYLDSVPPIGDSHPWSVDVGYFSVRDGRFDVTTFKSFDLPGL